jgi:hypothetical protein
MSFEALYLISFSLIVGMKIICFILGYLTIRLGHQLIASGAKGEFKFSTRLGGFKTDLASVSPGLLFVLLGVGLIAYAIHVEKDVDLDKKTGNAPMKPTTYIPTEHP